MSMKQGACIESWMWDYFSIKDDAICMSVCDICGKEERHRVHPDSLDDMRRHLFTNHTDIYNGHRNKEIIHWESYFERVQCSTDSINGNINCRNCNYYNDILLRVWIGLTMERHLKEHHNVTISDWDYLRNWRYNNTEDYYDLTEEHIGSIKRTRLCKKCNHHFRRSNLIIMLKHLIQVHNLIPDVPSDKLPTGLLQLNYPVVDASSSQEPSTSGSSDSSLPKPAGSDLKVWRPWANEDP